MNARFLSMFAVVVAPMFSAFGQSMRESIVGVWQAAEVTHTGPSGPETIKPGPNLTIFTSKHYSRIDVQTDKPRPVLANPSRASAEELRDVWGPLVAEAGSYEVTDSLITLRPLVAKNPAAMASGVSIVYSFKVEGNSLILTAQRDRSNSVASPLSVRFVRIE